MNEQGVCNNCRFFKQKGDFIGECRRRPPIVSDRLISAMLKNKDVTADNWGAAIDSIWGATVFPEVDNDSWCGEFEDDRAAAGQQYVVGVDLGPV